MILTSTAAETFSHVSQGMGIANFAAPIGYTNGMCSCLLTALQPSRLVVHIVTTMQR